MISPEKLPAEAPHSDIAASNTEQSSSQSLQQKEGNTNRKLPRSGKQNDAEDFQRLSREISRQSSKRQPRWWKIRFFKGMIDDVKRRAPYYWSDWKDAWDYRVVPATVYMYFAKYVKNRDTIHYLLQSEDPIPARSLLIPPGTCQVTMAAVLIQLQHNNDVVC